MDEPGPTPPSRSRLVRGVVIAALVVVAVVWWWWPTLARDPDRLDVLVVGVGEVREASEPIQRRIREEGMSVEILFIEPCRDSDRIAEVVIARSPAVVVVSPRHTCDDWIDVVDAARRGGDRTVIALAQTGALSDTDRSVLDDLDVTLADPSRLLGPEVVQRATCAWWDDCEADGQVQIRRPDGVLTDAGAQRVARVLTGNIP